MSRTIPVAKARYGPLRARYQSEGMGCGNSSRSEDVRRTRSRRRAQGVGTWSQVAWFSIAPMYQSCSVTPWCVIIHSGLLLHTWRVLVGM